MPTNVDRYFTYSHLPQHLQSIAEPISTLARLMDEVLPDGSEKSAGMRKLLEAKDCFVRAALPGEQENQPEIREWYINQTLMPQRKPNGEWTDLRKFEKLGE